MSTWIRHTHPNGFRSGQWAEVKAAVPGDDRTCYLVEFPDGVTDFWAVDDPDEPYEFSEGVPVDTESTPPGGTGDE